jgi:hypothetical protein
MKRNNKIIAVVLCAMLVFAGQVFPSEETTITGTVYAVAWDNDDNVIEAFIEGEGEDYIITDDSVGHQLFEMGGAYVEVKGVIGKDADGNRTITVVNYQVLRP